MGHGPSVPRGGGRHVYPPIPMNRDSVTGAYARTVLMERLDEEVRRGVRYGDTFALLVLDVDHFKSVNDAFGHSRGDAVLAEFAARVQAAARASDILFRYGGDEFVLFLPRTSREQAAALARRLADGIAATPFDGSPPLSLSVSVGVAAFPEDGNAAAALFDQADARMFQAKRGGDRVMAQDAPQRLSEALRTAGRLVERAEALEAANRFLDALPAARRGVLHLAGPRRSGRTRLLGEVEHLAGLRGYRVLPVRGRPELAQEPLGALRAACPHLDADALRPGSPEAVAAQVRRAAAIARGTALVVTVDDAGDLDRATVEVLGALAASPKRGPAVALVHTADPGGARLGPPDAPLRATVELTPLSRAGVRVWLRAALQVEPGEELVDWLHAQSGGLPGTVHGLLLQLVRRGALTARPGGAWAVQAEFRDLALRAAPAPAPRNLPALPGSLVDRDEALRETLRTLRQSRLVTLCGPAGVGKTRLAIEVAQEAAELFPDGVAWVEADAPARPHALWTDLAAALELGPASGGDPVVRLAAALRPLRLLLVIDGLDDAASCAPLLSRLLEGAPDLRLLVTARHRLHVAGEWTVALEGLSAPRAPQSERLMEYDAVRLFAQRAAALDAAPGEGTLPHVGRLAYALLGLPLAVETAAAQCGLLSCRELAHEVQAALDDLKGYLPGEPPERRVARTVLDVAWRLLPAQLRAALRRVSLFHAPFAPAAARRVAEAGDAELDALEERGLLRRTPDGHIRVHPLVRDYARAKLDDFPRERAEALAAYVDHHLLALRNGAGDGAMPDLRRAWDLAAREGAADALAQSADALFERLAARGAWDEAEHRFALAAAWLVEHGGADDALRVLEARLGAARVALDRVERAAPLLRRALQAAVRARDAGEEAHCLVWLARAHLLDGEPRLAAGAAASAVSAAERAESPVLRTRALCAAAGSAWAGGAPREAVERLYEAVEVDPEGPAAPEAWAQLVQTGERLLRAGEPALAAVLLSRAHARAPAPCAARADALLAEIDGREGGTHAVPPLVIITPAPREEGAAAKAVDATANASLVPA